MDADSPARPSFSRAAHLQSPPALKRTRVKVPSGRFLGRLVWPAACGWRGSKRRLWAAAGRADAGFRLPVDGEGLASPTSRSFFASFWGAFCSERPPLVGRKRSGAAHLRGPHLRQVAPARSPRTGRAGGEGAGSARGGGRSRWAPGFPGSEGWLLSDLLWSDPIGRCPALPSGASLRGPRGTLRNFAELQQSSATAASPSSSSSPFP